MEAAPAGALRELPTVEVLQLLVDRRHRCLRPWKAPAELCPVSHAKGSSQETESLVPVLKPGMGTTSGNPALHISIPVGETQASWIPGSVGSFQEEEKWQEQSYSK